MDQLDDLEALIGETAVEAEVKEADGRGGPVDPLADLEDMESSESPASKGRNRTVVKRKKKKKKKKSKRGNVTIQSYGPAEEDLLEVK